MSHTPNRLLKSLCAGGLRACACKCFFVFAVIPYTLIAPKAVKYMSRNAKQKWFRSKKGLFYPMICVVCVDDKMGMLFNHRRQSQDRALRVRLLTLCAHSRLWMNAYTYAQFQEQTAPQLCVDAQPLHKAAPGEYCLVEDIDPATHEAAMERIVLYRWNRTYPADRFFTIPLAEHGWRLLGAADFPGFSHERITEEVYMR